MTPGADAFRYCLNTSTVRGQQLGIVEELELAAEAGYDGIEPWAREVDAYLETGGSTGELRSRASDLGLTIENLVAFFEWVVDEPQRRSKGLEEARRGMQMAAELGCPHVAAPPMGATDVDDISLEAAAERYRALLEIGEECGVVPVLEFWGISSTLGRLSEAMCVAAQSGRRDACLLADVFHMYKGGSPYGGLRLLGPHSLAVFHMNDFPAQPPRQEIADADRIYPGDGVAPLDHILRDLHEIGFRGPLSLELFNEDYWACDALEVARSGLEKMRAAVERGLSG